MISTQGELQAPINIKDPKRYENKKNCKNMLVAFGIEEINLSKTIYPLNIYFKNKYLKLLPQIFNSFKRITKGI